MQIPDAVRAFLTEPRFAVVATVGQHGAPHQTVLWYELQGDEILLNTAAGRKKEDNLRQDPRVSLCIEDGYRYVTITGKVELNEDQQVAQEDIRRLAIRYNGEQEGERQARDQFGKQHRITIRVKIDRLHAYGFGA
jgi:PPOX class probable F420-dependent enzyme